MKKQAELLKQRFGSAISTEMKDNEIVCIPGLQGTKSARNQSEEFGMHH